ncbi:MAG: ATP-binding protein [Prevotellaceae bacterium]|jgi:hypothetical protein|nr:ATP-binding protein [Prevotellaceae bacterium]
MQELHVEAQLDFLERISKTRPIYAISEIIWNSLDADAKGVRINFFGNEISTDRIEISDDGNGFSHELAIDTFGKLGGSWKRNKLQTSEKRWLHGKEGRGRFRVFTIGHNVEWHVTYQENDIFYEYVIKGQSDRLDKFQISDKETSDSRKTGTTVIIQEPLKQYQLFQSDILVNELAAIYAPYLSSYPDVNIRVGTEKVDLQHKLKEKTLLPIEAIIRDESGEEYTSELEVFEWNNLDVKELYYCDKNGFPLLKYEKQIRGNIGKYSYTAYLKSDYFVYLKENNELDLIELKEELVPLRTEALKKLKKLFLERYREEHKSIIEKWKKDDVYPYSERNDKTIVETAEEQVFDILALNLNEYLDDFDNINNKQKKLQLKLLQQAVAFNPTNLKKIIDEIISLPNDKADELIELLDNTSLSSIISTSTLISDRLKFIEGFSAIVYDIETKTHIKERSQLHKILADNPWFFGEEFSLSVSDQSLTEVLRKYHSKLADGIVIDTQTPVLRPDGKIGIVDLMLSRSVPKNHEKEYEFLVIELKAPKVSIGQNELNQIESYAFAVAEDERFRGLKTRWEFWVISNEMDSIIRKKANERNRPRGTTYQSDPTEANDITIKVRTWSEIISENKFRYKFVKDHLDISITESDGLLYLQEKYNKYLA